MVRRLTISRWLSILTLGLTCAGCADLPSRRGESGTHASPPPAPAPAAPPMPPLQISGPAAQAAQPTAHAELVVRGRSLPDAAAERLVPVAQGEVAAPTQAARQLRTLHRLAEQRYASVEGYVVRLRQREVIAGKKRPEEIVLLKFRREPWSVYLRWLGGEGKGREVIYVPGRHGNMIHSLTAGVDVPLPGMAGKHIKAAPDSPLVLARCRRPISQTGIGALIDSFGRVVDAIERGDTHLGTMRCLGPIKRPEFEVPVEAVLQLVPAGAENELPRGGQRFWFFDTNLHFPILVVTQDDAGNEVEYYCYDRFLFPDRFRDDEFDPDRLWGR
jgi:hypothetical protein